METIAKAKRIGGSIGIIIPMRIANKERIRPNDTVRIRIERIDSLGWLFGRHSDVKIPTEQIMHEIDEGEDE